jgi:mannose-1-phosphate guanylyltransferase
MKMFEHYFAVIMAGGGGTRLWPLSNQDTPKQMLLLGEDRSLFQIAIDRLQGLFAPDHIYVVTVAEQAEQLQQQRPQVPKENYLIEPMPRGTASVVGLAAVALQKRDPQAVMAVLTADHFIKNEDRFKDLLGAAYQVAEKDYLVTLGIHPTYPATGYGYIQRGRLIEQVGGFTAYDVLRFREKPDEETARAFIASGNHDWNSGMFMWRVERILEEIQRLMPELFATLKVIGNAWNTDRLTDAIEGVWPGIKSQTIDYGIMERAERVAVLPAQELGWNDVGSWNSLFDVLQSSENGNIILDAKHIDLDTHNSLIVSDDPDRLIVTIGVDHLVIVNTGNALLVCSVEEAQRVRDAVKVLKEKGWDQYL